MPSELAAASPLMVSVPSSACWLILLCLLAKFFWLAGVSFIAKLRLWTTLCLSFLCFCRLYFFLLNVFLCLSLFCYSSYFCWYQSPSIQTYLLLQVSLYWSFMPHWFLSTFLDMTTAAVWLLWWKAYGLLWWEVWLLWWKVYTVTVVRKDPTLTFPYTRISSYILIKFVALFARQIYSNPTLVK
jgi:hypothetical protein